jgi:hypothetical protein
MKYVKYAAETAVILCSTYLIVWWWLGTAWSERYWTWLNRLLGGQIPGLASDVELVSVLLLALLASTGATFWVFRLFDRYPKKKY